MIIAAIRKPLRSAGIGASLAVGVALLVGAGGADAQGTAGSPTAVSATGPVQKGAVGRQLWRISDYTTVELVAREAGARDNQQPWRVDPNALHGLLQPVQVLRSGKPRPLFGMDELNTLVGAIAEALGNARPDQDVAIVSAARHEDNTFWSLSAMTARLFVVDNHVNLIVHDARYDFYDSARGTGTAPHFTIGSRAAPGAETLLAETATNTRPDWLVLGAVVAAAAPAVVVPPAAFTPPAPVAPPAAIAPPAPVVAAPAVPAAVAPAAAQDAEQRLTTLKRLYDKGLITKSEYESKRAEILKGL